MTEIFMPLSITIKVFGKKIEYEEKTEARKFEKNNQANHTENRGTINESRNRWIG